MSQGNNVGSLGLRGNQNDEYLTNGLGPKKNIKDVEDIQGTSSKGSQR